MAKKYTGFAPILGLLLVFGVFDFSYASEGKQAGLGDAKEQGVELEKPDLKQERKPDKLPVEAMARAIQEVEKIRGLKFKKAVPMAWVTTEECINHMQRIVRKPGIKPVAEGSLTLLRYFELLPAKLTLEKYVERLATAGVAGYYDPEAKKFQVLTKISDMPDDVLQTTLVHELTHAFQDEETDLFAFYYGDNFNNDQLGARMSVIEGEATLVHMQSEFLAAGSDFVKSDVDLGQVLRDTREIAAVFGGAMDESLMFPYTTGSSFMRDYVRKHGWNEITRLYTSPPDSTEQVLCSEKFLSTKARDYPVTLGLADASKLFGKSYRRLLSTSFGQYYLSLILRAKLAEPELAAELAAAGWDGDTIDFYREDGGTQASIVWLTRWDRPEDAEQFFNVYQVSAGRRLGMESRNENWEVKNHWAKSEKTKLGMIRRGNGSEGTILIERRGIEVLIIEKAPAQILEEIRRLAWRAKRIYHVADKDKGQRDAATTANYEAAFTKKWKRDHKGGKQLKGNHYVDKTNRFELDLPEEGWEILEEKSFVIVKSDNGLKGARFSIEISQPGLKVDFKELVHVAREQIDAEFGLDACTINEVVDTAAGQTFRLQYSDHGKTFYQQWYLRDGKAFVLALGVDKKHEEKAIKALKVVFESFRFLEQEAPQPEP